MMVSKYIKEILDSPRTTMLVSIDNNNLFKEIYLKNCYKVGGLDNRPTYLYTIDKCIVGRAVVSDYNLNESYCSRTRDTIWEKYKEQLWMNKKTFYNFNGIVLILSNIEIFDCFLTPYQPLRNCLGLHYAQYFINYGTTAFLSTVYYKNILDLEFIDKDDLFIAKGKIPYIQNGIQQVEILDNLEYLKCFDYADYNIESEVIHFNIHLNYNCKPRKATKRMYGQERFHDYYNSK